MAFNLNYMASPAQQPQKGQCCEETERVRILVHVPVVLVVVLVGGLVWSTIRSQTIMVHYTIQDALEAAYRSPFVIKVRHGTSYQKPTAPLGFPCAHHAARGSPRTRIRQPHSRLCVETACRYVIDYQSCARKGAAPKRQQEEEEEKTGSGGLL